MTREHVNQRVRAMGELVEASEWISAARFEHALWADVLEAIYNGGWGAEDLAGAAIATRQYEFPRFSSRAPARL